MQSKEPSDWIDDDRIAFHCRALRHVRLPLAALVLANAMLVFLIPTYVINPRNVSLHLPGSAWFQSTSRRTNTTEKDKDDVWVLLPPARVAEIERKDWVATTFSPSNVTAAIEKLVPKNRVPQFGTAASLFTDSGIAWTSSFAKIVREAILLHRYAMDACPANGRIASIAALIAKKLLIWGTADRPHGIDDMGSPLILRNASEGSVSFMLNGQVRFLAAGEQLTVGAVGEHVVRFHRGSQFGEATHRIKGGVYDFTATERGWQLMETSPAPQ